MTGSTRDEWDSFLTDEGREKVSRFFREPTPDDVPDGAPTHMPPAMHAITCRRVAVRIRELAESASPAPWWSEQGSSEGAWPRDYVSNSGSQRRFRAPSEADAVHIAAWSPVPAVAAALVLEAAAVQIELLDTGAPLSSRPELLAAVRLAHAFEQSQPSVPDDPERLMARLEELKAQRAAGRERPEDVAADA